MRRLLAASIATAALGFIVGGVAAPALAGSNTATTLRVRAADTRVDGRPVFVRAKLTDAKGEPVPGELLRLVVPVEFMGSSKDEIVGEATTDDAGTAVLRFSPAAVGTVEATVTFRGGHGYAPSQAAISFEVVRAVVTYAREPAGLQAWWARAGLIPLPFAGVWITYLVVLSLAVRMRRAGRGSEPSERTAER